MTYQPTVINDDLRKLPQLPAWVTSGRSETLETVVFRSGAVLTVLDMLVSDPAHGVPTKLLSNRLALSAAVATSKLEGRMAQEADIRDAFHLAQSGEARGPDGDLLAFWREAARVRAVRPSDAALFELVGPNYADDVEDWISTGRNRTKTHGPLAGCALVMRSVLEADDRAERVACLMSDLVLAEALNWPRLLPVSAQFLSKCMLRDLVGGGPEAALVVQGRLLEAQQETTRLAREFARRAAALRAIAPKLRAKGSDAAVTLFLCEEAVAPSTMLSPMIQGTAIAMTDRAARRLCDRLVELGVVRELTGRATFRLYGIAP